MALGVLSIVPFGAAQEPQCAFLCCPAALAGISMLLSCLSIPFGVPFGVQQGPWCTLDGARMPWCVFQGVFQCGPVTLTRPSKQHSCLGGGLSAQLRYLGGTFGTAQVPQWAFGCIPGHSACLSGPHTALKVPFSVAQGPGCTFQCHSGPLVCLSTWSSCLFVPFSMVQLFQWTFWQKPDNSVCILMPPRALGLPFEVAQVPQHGFYCSPGSSVGCSVWPSCHGWTFRTTQLPWCAFKYGAAAWTVLLERPSCLSRPFNAAQVPQIVSLPPTVLKLPFGVAQGLRHTFQCRPVFCSVPFGSAHLP